ncbi:hypothetical protein M378DRAFT_84610 [Amanita muscaria Koide BX008]|uniref:Uncharacterized protein n=1 Tax=Amanita muscaria (strain Koide BX008) TaxID=946122 RepID=A0A0C2WTY5_AMAMK|nr:hypothetical protein M378DRAFT_84610 [Amanita muscaria Koide BX008]
MAKRSREDIDVDELINSINLDKGLRAGLLELTADELAALLADFANSANLPTAAFKKARLGLPSFSTVKWAEFAEEYGLPLNPSYLGLEPFTTPRYRLPPSLHETMFENAWRWQDVYREKVDQGREEGKARLLEPYIVPIIALFQGRVIDEPEQAVVATKYSTGGDVEHEIFMIGGILFLVIEFKVGTPSHNNLAQLFLELLSAAERNNRLNFAGLRVYGLFTDLTQFKFYSYNPTSKEFCQDENILINNKRTAAFSDMIDVSNKIFGVILTAYMDGLREIIRRSKDRARQNEFHIIGITDPSKLTGEEKKTGSRKSTDQWEAALVLAERCVDKFNEPIVSIQDIEARANGALELLTKSVCSIPRASSFSGDKDPSTPTELSALAVAVIKAEHEHYLSTININD